MVKVTVYITAHNYGHFLLQSIESVLRQKYDSWELIVINDGSTDNTKGILEKFTDHQKIKIIHQKNKGLTTSNNIATRMSQGEYLMRLDADDYLDENALLVLANILETHPHIGLVYPDYYRIDENGEVLDIQRRKKLESEVDVLDLPAHGACTMIRKSCLMELGGYDESIQRQDGYDLWIRFIQRFKPYNVNIPLFYYRQHGDSLTLNKQELLATRRRIKRNFVRSNILQMPQVLAIIPVQKRTQPLPNLSFKKLAGKYLLDFTLEEACKSSVLGKIVLTSDDEDVLGYVEKYPKIQKIKRPEELALPNTRIEPTVSYVLEHLREKQNYQPDAVMLLYPHTPLRKKSHIETAIDTMVIFDMDSVISVCEDIHIFYQHTKKGLSPLFPKRQLRLERDALYQENGAVYVSKVNKIKSDSFLGEKLGHVVMLPEESIKIDSSYHLWLAETILEKWNLKLYEK
ncbi:MAG: glycosyltransferase [Deltaproteobacteria bacterium]|nr:glycosyltransferase [Deltaproteobacteria bacterium]